MTSCFAAPPAVPFWPLWSGTVTLLGTIWLAGPIMRLQAASRWSGPNWRGRIIPNSLGLVLALSMPAGVGVATLVGYVWVPAYAGLTAMVTATLLGIVDDGAPPAGRGWRTHWRGLATGQWTTGSLKVAGIPLGALAATVTLCDSFNLANLFWMFFAAGVVAGTANVINLLDTGPGRALKCTFLLALFPAFLGSPAAAAWLFPVAMACLALLPVDLTEQGMLGDSGANALGAALGFGLILAWSGFVEICIMFLSVVALQWLGDRFSLVKFIRSSPSLNFFDEFGRWNHNPDDEAAGGTGVDKKN